jgi:multiple sugar transport system permease protein
MSDTLLTKTPSRSQRRRAKAWKQAGITILVLGILLTFLLPLFYGASMSIKSKEQIAALDSSLIPRSASTFSYEGQDLPIYEVPQVDGTVKELAILDKTRTSATLVDPVHPEAPPVVWQGSWRTLKPVTHADPQWQNYPKAWTAIDFLLLLKNTALYGLVTTIGTVFSSSLVAYGFARFRFPGKNVLFFVLIATIILPPAVTLIPTYAFFFQIGWVGTWLPLMVPSFFANAYNVFLLRQFIMGIPRELDEAAKIDGAGPIRTFYTIIVPQSLPAIIAVSLFNFFFCWNDFFGPLIYLAGHPELQPISLGLTQFNNMYTTQTHLVQAAALLACALPLVVFFSAQKFFMQGVVTTGVDK